jgi:hypothetical protein
MSPLRLLSATVFVASAAWISQGAVAFGDSGATRLGLLPISLPAILIVLAASAGVVLLVRGGAPLAPVALLALVLLPWLPVPAPAAFQMWSGPVALTVWIALFLSLLLSLRRGTFLESGSPAMAGLLAFVMFSFAAWRVSPTLPAGDEPHYLIITQSLLTDGDLKIENNHRRGDYHGYFAGDLSKPDYYRRGRNGEIYSVHAPGVAALVLPAFALGGYPAVVIFLVLLSSLTAALAWGMAFRVTGSGAAAWFGWASVVFAPPVLLNAFTVYPDGPGGLFVLTGVWALVRAREERASNATSVIPWLLHGAALAALPWLHTRFALLAGGLGALVLLHLAWTTNPAAKASAFLVVPALSALAWIAFFVAIYGAPDPAIPYRGSDLGSAAYIASGLAGLFFDQLYGLFPYAPVLAVAFCGFVALSRTGDFRFLPLELTFVIIPYLLTVTHFAMWWGGHSSAARFLVPVIPALAISAAAAWSGASRRTTQAVIQVSLAATIFIAAVVVLVDRGRLAYYSREGVYAPWLEWASHVVDLQHGLPSFFARIRRGQQPGEIFFLEILVWIALFAAAWLVLRAAERSAWLRSRGPLYATTVVAFAAAAMVALTISWRLDDVTGLTPVAAQLDLLRRATQGTQSVALDLSTLKPIDAQALAPRLAVRVEARPFLPLAPRDDRPLFSLPQVPAGEYSVSVERRGSGGWLMAGVGRDQFALVTAPAETFANDVRIRFPVDVRAMVVRGDEDARQQVRALRVRPLTLLRTDEKVSPEMARRAVRYGGLTVFFMDEWSFPEPGLFWIGGARSASIVLQPDTPQSAVMLWLRNAPVANDLMIDTGGHHDTLHLAGGEERRVPIPIDAARGAAAVTFTTSSGFRPSAADPSSRDGRFLGVMVKVDQESTK